MPNVAFVDFHRLHDPVRAELHAAAAAVIDGGKFIGGTPVTSFEREMAAHGGFPEVIGTACGTSALQAALKALGVGPGDEVIVPALTAICTAEAVTLCGATAIFADLEADGFCLCPQDVARRITPRTKGIIPVHLYGQPANLCELLNVAQQHGLWLLEDCAQAQGALYGTAQVGTIGEAAAFSFFPSKALGCLGDGGAATAKDAAVRRYLRMFCNHGRESKYDHEFEGLNSRLDALQAALLRVLLPQLNGWNAARRERAGWYRELLAGIPNLVLPVERPGTTPVYHLYVVLVPDRDGLQATLKREGIETLVHYPAPLHLLKAYAHRAIPAGTYPRAEYVAAHCLSLPMHPHLTRAEAEAVAAGLRRALS